MIAICQIRAQPYYRREAFERGLRAVGYRLVTGGQPSGPEDLLVIWNRYGAFHSMANAWEAKGGTVLVVENGYIGKDEDGRQYYAISAHGHNGSGWFPVGNEDRWVKLAIPILPWREFKPEAYYLVCGQRGIGSPTMASPKDWHLKAALAVYAFGGHPHVRLHPGNKEPLIPLADDLRGASGCLIWSSSAGVRALTMGIPVIYDAPYWICSSAATRLALVPISGGSTFRPREDLPREEALQRMAYAQWSVLEIEYGEPFARFKAAIEARKVAA